MPVDDIEAVLRHDAVGEPPGCGLTDCEWRAQSMPAVEASDPADKFVEVDPIGRRSRGAAAVLADLAPEEFAVFVAEQRHRQCPLLGMCCARPCRRNRRCAEARNEIAPSHP
jgi:hypothetical protein